MKYMTRISYSLLILILVLGLACGGDTGDQDTDKSETKSTARLTVVATTGMIGDIVRNVGGPSVDLHVLMGPGVDPHLYKAREGDVRKMMEANIIFYNGLHLEGAMGEILEQMEGHAFAVTERIDPGALIKVGEFKDTHDPHVWFDVRFWMIATEYVRDVMIENDPDFAEVYWEDAQIYLDQLTELHDFVYQSAKQIPEELRVLVTAHDAFNYFGRAYGFEVHGLQGISTAAEAGTADVQNLAKLIVDKKVPAIFIETSIPRRNVEAVQAAVKARGFDVKIGGDLFSDAMGDPETREGTYIGMVEHNITTIKQALFSRTMKDPTL